jgi:hypothetical protein
LILSDSIENTIIGTQAKCTQKALFKRKFNKNKRKKCFIYFIFITPNIHFFLGVCTNSTTGHTEFQYVRHCSATLTCWYLELEGFGVGDVNGGYLFNLLAHLVRHIVPGTQREGQRLREPALRQTEKTFQTNTALKRLL